MNLKFKDRNISKFEKKITISRPKIYLILIRIGVDAFAFAYTFIFCISLFGPSLRDSYALLRGTYPGDVRLYEG